MTTASRVPIGERKLGSVVPNATLGILTALASAYVLRYGVPIPYSDEWTSVARIVGDLPTTIEWLWEPLADHVIPLSRLVHMAVIRLGCLDFRAGMVFNVAALAFGAAALLSAVRSARRAPSWTDVVVPLSILSLGQYENLLWSMQMVFVLPITLSYLALAAIAQSPEASDWSVLGVATCLLPLPLLDPAGALIAPPLALWTVAASRCHLASKGAGTRFPASLAMCLALVTLALATGVAVRLSITDGLPAWAVADAPARAVEALSTVFGAPSIPLHRVVALFVILLWSAAVAAACARVPPVGPQRLRNLGFLAFLASWALLVIGLGYQARAIGSGLALRSAYVTLTAPLVPAVHLVFTTSGPKRVAHLVSGLLIAALVIAMPFNVIAAADFARMRHTRYEALVRDAHAGLPLEALVGRHAETISDDDFREVGPYLETLAAHRLGPFRAPSVRLIREARALTTQDVPLQAVQVHQIDLASGMATGDDPYVTFALSESTDVVGAILEFRLSTPSGRDAWVHVWWADSNNPGRNFFTPWERHTEFWAPSRTEGQSYRIWIYDRINWLRIDPDSGPCRFAPLRLQVLTAGQ